MLTSDVFRLLLSFSSMARRADAGSEGWSGRKGKGEGTLRHRGQAEVWSGAFAIYRGQSYLHHQQYLTSITVLTVDYITGLDQGSPPFSACSRLCLMHLPFIPPAACFSQPSSMQRGALGVSPCSLPCLLHLPFTCAYFSQPSSLQRG